MQFDMQRAEPKSDLLFDWSLDVTRLERDAQSASTTNTPNDWALVEAECSLDLIDAEISAARAAPSGPQRDATIARLVVWRGRVDRVIRQLRAVPRSS